MIETKSRIKAMLNDPEQAEHKIQASIRKYFPTKPKGKILQISPHKSTTENGSNESRVFLHNPKVQRAPPDLKGNQTLSEGGETGHDKNEEESKKN